MKTIAIIFIIVVSANAVFRRENEQQTLAKQCGNIDAEGNFIPIEDVDPVVDLVVDPVDDPVDNPKLDCTTLTNYAKECFDENLDWHSSITVAYPVFHPVCPAVVDTNGGNCKDYCATQGLDCLMAQDNTGSSCTLDGRHERQTTEENGCLQNWGNQVCACGYAAAQPVVAPVVVPVIVDPVTCTLTVDNQLREVQYNGAVLQADGAYENWGAVKTINFEAERCNPGKLRIQGFNFEGHPDGGGYAGSPSDACQSAGLQLSCEAPEGSGWYQFGSDRDNWTAEGVNVAGVTKYRDAPSDLRPCETSSGFSLSGNKYGQKIWAESGEAEAVMTGGPQVPAGC